MCHWNKESDKLDVSAQHFVKYKNKNYSRQDSWLYSKKNFKTMSSSHFKRFNVCGRKSEGFWRIENQKKYRGKSRKKQYRDY